MPYDWAAWATKINDKIDRFGGAGAIRPESGPDVPVKVIVAVYDQQERDGEMIQATDKKVFVSPTGISTEPTTSDRIVLGGAAHRIVSVDLFKPDPDGAVLCYVLQVR